VTNTSTKECIVYLVLTNTPNLYPKTSHGDNAEGQAAKSQYYKTVALFSVIFRRCIL